MAEPDRTPEGWRVPFRRTALIAVAVPFALLALLVLAGWGYDRTLRPVTKFTVTPLAAPHLETQVNTPTLDPMRTVKPPATDARIAAAKSAVAREGLPGWDTKP